MTAAKVFGSRIDCGTSVFIHKKSDIEGQAVTPLSMEYPTALCEAI